MADYIHTIDRWDEATGENLIERIAGVSDYQVAVETYRAAVKRWPGAKITLRNRARVTGPRPNVTRRPQPAPGAAALVISEARLRSRRLGRGRGGFG